MYIVKNKDMKIELEIAKQNAKCNIICTELDRLIKLLNNPNLNITREELADQLCEIVDFAELI